MFLGLCFLCRGPGSVRCIVVDWCLTSLQRPAKTCRSLWEAGEAGASAFPTGVEFLRGRERRAILNVSINVLNPVKTARKVRKSL